MVRMANLDGRSYRAACLHASSAAVLGRPGVHLPGGPGQLGAPASAAGSLSAPAASGAALAPLARKAALGKRRAPQVARFLLDIDRHAAQLAAELADRSYRPGPGRAFWIRDPKPRCIFALPFRDRVVQHLLIAQTLPAIERALAPQTYACRLGMGTHRCLQRAADLFLRFPCLLSIDVQKFLRPRARIRTHRPSPGEIQAQGSTILAI
jgi:hypothetical protein